MRELRALWWLPLFCGLLIVVGAAQEKQPPRAPFPDLQVFREQLKATPARELLQAFHTLLEDVTPPATPEQRVAASEVLRGEILRRVLETDTVEKERLFVVNHLLGQVVHSLTPKESKALSQKFALRQDDPAKLRISELRSKVELYRVLNGDPQEAERWVAEWLAVHPLNDLDLHVLRWLAEIASESSFRWKKQVAVRWTGTIRVPKDAAYTFAASRFQEIVGSRKSRLRVWVNEQPVLDTDQAVRGQPTELKAAQETPLRAEFYYQPGNNDYPEPPIRPLVALLEWEGPGLVMSPVPAAVLTPAENEPGPGLLAIYRFNQEAAGQLRRVDATVDLVGLRRLGPWRDAAWRQSLIQALATQYAKSDFVPELEYEPYCWSDLAELTTASDRQAILKDWAKQEAWLRRLGPADIFSLNILFRPGATEEANAFVLAWLQADPLIALPLRKWEFVQECTGWSNLAETLISEQPECLAQLEKIALVRRDGGCSVATLRLLAHVHFRQGTFDKWVENLSKRLDDSTLGDEERASWLFACAAAEKIRKGEEKIRGARGNANQESYRQAHLWLKEALQLAENEERLQQIFQEMLAELVQHNQWNEISTLLAQAQAELSMPTSLEAIQQWEAIVKDEQERDRLEVESQRQIAEATRQAKEQQRMQNAARQAAMRELDAKTRREAAEATRQAKEQQRKQDAAHQAAINELDAKTRRQVAEATRLAKEQQRMQNAARQAAIRELDAKTRREVADAKLAAEAQNRAVNPEHRAETSYVEYSEHVQSREDARVAELRRRLKLAEQAKQHSLTLRYREQLRIWAPKPDSKISQSTAKTPSSGSKSAK